MNATGSYHAGRFMRSLALRAALGRPVPALTPPFDFAIGRAKIETDEESPLYGRKLRRCLARGARNRRHVVSREYDGKLYTYHATKGWRVNRGAA